MASPVDNLTELLSRLHLESDRKNVLKQVKTVLSNVHPNELEEICERLQLTPLFDCLNSDSKEIEIASEALGRLLSPLPPATIFNQYQTELIRGLNHPEPAVKQLVLKQLSRCADDEAANSSLKNIELLVTVVSLLADSVGVAKDANRVLINLTKFEGGLSMLFTAAVLNCLKEVMMKSDEIRYRCYELIVSISQQSELVLHKCDEAGLLGLLISEIDSEDILVKKNCLAMLTDLAMTSHGLQYLDQQGVVKKLENMLKQLDSDVFSRLLMPGLLQFFGHVGHLYPREICNRYRGFVVSLFEAIESDNWGVKGVAIQTVGILGDSVEGKFALERMGPLMKRCLSSIGSTIKANSTPEMKVTALNAVAALVAIKESEQTTETEELLKSWFDCLSDQPAELIRRTCRLPFRDERCAAMAVFKALANQSWGQQYINDLPGFFEYLFDRRTETDKEGKEAKYEIIKTLFESPTAHNTVGTVVLARLKAYVREGPFFVRVESAVASDAAE